MEYKTTIREALEELGTLYNKDPDNFFNEHDFHHLFFNIIYPKLKNFIHPEYPTLKRFNRKKKGYTDYVSGKHSFEPDSKVNWRRGHYDFVVIEQDFYNRCKNEGLFYKLSNKTVKINKDEKEPYLEVALEFKYFIEKVNLEELKFDIFKLKEGREIKTKMLIIFTKNVSKEEINKINKLNNKSIETWIYSNEGVKK